MVKVPLWTMTCITPSMLTVFALLQLLKLESSHSLMSKNQVENIIMNPIVTIVITKIKTYIYNVWSNTLTTIMEELVSSVTLLALALVS